jgi:beta-galactosidase
VTPKVEGTCGEVVITAYVAGNGDVKVSLFDADGKIVAGGNNGEKLKIDNVRLWNGLEDPYLYTAKAQLFVGGECVDEVSTRCGFRTYSFDPKKGFFLNGKSYPLRGVSRHQDRPKKGNALTKADHEEDMRLIREIGANTIRLAHYQHDDYFYDLCDENGLVIWAEIPYISRHMPEANNNALHQMKELVFQQYNHPSIVMWGISNEITMYRKNRKNMLEFHKKLNATVKEMDPTRPTTLACFAMCGPFNKVAHITDIVAWNLYLGWYVPGFFLNDLWMWFYHTCYPKSCLGYSEYGAEAMPNLHSRHPKRGDNSEEYQANYHEYMLRCFERHPYLWGTYVWNMFDFAADARNQGGEPGMNHKGLVTFDRKTKKDSFYAYKAYWSKEPFVHIAGKRFANRTGGSTVVKVYTNTNGVKLFNNGTEIAGKTKDGKVFEFKIKLEKVNNIKAVGGKIVGDGKATGGAVVDGAVAGDTIVNGAALELVDECVINKVETPDSAYKLHVKSETQSWQK